MQQQLAIGTLAAVIFASGMFACGDDDPSGDDHAHDDHSHDAAAHDAAAHDAATDTGASEQLEIVFEGRVGSEPFACTRTYEVGSEGTMVMPRDFKLYVHDFRLITAAGDEQALELEQDGTWQRDDVALLDFEDKTGSCSNGTTLTRTKVVAVAPKGGYAGLAFRIGVPEGLNHQNQATAASPLNLEGMFWSWLGGYKFLRIDVSPAHEREMMGNNADDAGPGHRGGAMGFPTHLGSTMCTGNPMSAEGVTCMRPNRPEVRLAAFDASKQKIVVDLAKLLSTTDVSNNGGAEPGCMSGPMDPDCGSVFEQLGVDFATGDSRGSPAFLSATAK